MSGPDAEIRAGNALPLRNIPVGTVVHAIELKPGAGAKMARSAGASVQLMAKEGTMATLRLPSGETRLVPAICKATVGSVGNVEHELIQLGKAGRARWQGKRPSVRGVAMNPVDHPLGGGEGKSSGGRHPTSPWGQKEGRTRKKKKASSKYIVRRRGKAWLMPSVKKGPFVDDHLMKKVADMNKQARRGGAHVVAPLDDRQEMLSP